VRRARRSGQEEVERRQPVDVEREPVRAAGRRQDRRDRGQGRARGAEQDDVVVRRAARKVAREEVRIAVAVEVADGEDVRRRRDERRRERRRVERERAAAAVPPDFGRHAETRGGIGEDDVEVAVRFEVGDERAARRRPAPVRRRVRLARDRKARRDRERPAAVREDRQRAGRRADAGEQVGVAVAVEVRERERPHVDGRAEGRARGGEPARAVVQERSRAVEQVDVPVEVDVAEQKRRATRRDLVLKEPEERRRVLRVRGRRGERGGEGEEGDAAHARPSLSETGPPRRQSDRIVVVSAFVNAPATGSTACQWTSSPTRAGRSGTGSGSENAPSAPNENAPT
jgi:hypothetical protein